jgi:hypothetical protein
MHQLFPGDRHAARQNPGFSLRSPGANGLTEFATSVTMAFTPIHRLHSGEPMRQH